MTSEKPSRKSLFRWAGWFFVANTVFYVLIGCNYLAYLPDFAHIPLITHSGIILGWVFMLTGLLGQLALFAFAGCLVAIILIFLYPKKWFAFVVGSVIALLIALFLVLDSLIYHLYHYHLAGVIWHVFRAGVASQVLVLSLVEWLWIVAIAIVLFAIEFAMAFGVWRCLVKRNARRYGWQVALVLAAALFLSYTLTLSTNQAVTADAMTQSNDHVLVMEAQIIPYYNAVLGELLPGKNAGLALETRDDGYFVQNAQINKPLRYPLHPLQCVMPKKHPNIVMIVLDAWRFDMMNPKVTPHIAAFAKKSLVFTNNFSGGNATQPGIFSLFYSIPANYWTAMLNQHQGPLLIHQLLKNHYQMGIFRSASLHYPAFDDTVFREVPHLIINTEGSESFDRDRKITEEFKHFMQTIDPKKPFFSFVFYDETHNYCESSVNYAKPFQPAIATCNRLLLKNDSNPIPYLNRYRNAAHFDDALVQQVLLSLQAHHQLQNTIVMITADHGEEFNESHQNYWGHASDYTPWQIHTPLIVYWPGHQPQIVRQPTNHYDVVPTLMQNVMGCQNPTHDYSVGNSLFSTKTNSHFLIVNSYIDYGIVEKKKVTRIYPAGNYAIYSPVGVPLPQATLNIKTLKQVFTMLNQYFH